MENKISKDEVEHIAKLARLHLTSEEVGKYTEQLGEVLDYVSQLPDERAKSYEVGIRSGNGTLRNDEIRSSEASAEELLANAPQMEGASIKVPAVLGGDDE